jgi:hypothetical protein
MADPIGNLGQWFAVKLEDGTGDNELYPTKSICIRHQHGQERYFAYCQIRPTAMTVCDAEIFLSVSRRMYAAGVRMEDPHQPIKRASREDMASQMRTIESGGRFRPSNLIIPGGK